MMDHISSTGKIREPLTSLETKIMKLNQLLFTSCIMETTRNGMSSILMRLSQSQLRASTKNLASISTDHSTWYQECHSRELLLCTETIGSTLEDGPRLMPNILNGDSMRNLRQYSTCTGRTMSWKFTPTVDIHTLEPLQPKTQDGGRCSTTKMDTLSIKRVRSSMFKEQLILKEDIFNAMRITMVRFINNGTLSTLMNMQKSQPRDNSTRTSVSMLKDLSMS
jgi:hypothetical protein